MSNITSTSMPLQFKRLYKGPLDDSTIFFNYDSAVAYGKSGTAYPGQIISVYLEDVAMWAGYMIGNDGSISPLSTGGSSGGGCWDILELT